MFNYEEGMRVRLREKGKSSKDKGTVTEVDSREEVKVQWDGREESVWEETRFLMPDEPEAEAKLKENSRKVQEKINAAAASLEEAFKNWREAIALENGWDNPSEYGVEGAWSLRNNPDLDLSKFEEAVEDNGWSTSSIYC